MPLARDERANHGLHAEHHTHKDEDDEWHAARSWDRLADADDRVRRPLGRVS